jgi:hypothetical protein
MKSRNTYLTRQTEMEFRPEGQGDDIGNSFMLVPLMYMVLLYKYKLYMEVPVNRTVK